MPVGGASQPADGPSAIQYGWLKFRDNWSEIIVAVIIGFALILVVEVVGYLLFHGLTDSNKVRCSFSSSGFNCSEGPSFFARLAAQGIYNALFWLAGAALQLFVIRATLQIVRGERLDASKIMSGENVGPYIVAALIVAVAAFVGFIFLVIPGLVVLFFAHFYGYFIVDKNMSPIEAIGASFNLVKSNLGVVFVFYLLCLLVTLVGLLACLVGLVIAWPVVVIATGYMYKRLQGEPVAA
jgi:uncharacterized membrane protein